MKVGQIVKVTPQGLNKLCSLAFARRLEGALGLVVQEKYDLSYKLDQDKLPERVKIYPSSVQFQ